MTTAIEVRGVRRTFDGREVLRGIDLTVGAGEFVAIVGRSGCGKSTLLKMLAGLDEPTSGTVEVQGRRALGFQDARLLPWQRVWRNVVFGLQGRKAELREVAVKALGEVELGERADVWPSTLSGGEAQRVALARSLVREPSVLFLDEPFGALDALTRLRMQALLLQLWRRKGLTVVLVTHDVEEALLLADRVIVLDEGVISDEFTIDLDRPRDRTNSRFEEFRVRVLAGLGVSDLDSLLMLNTKPERQPA